VHTIRIVYRRVLSELIAPIARLPWLRVLSGDDGRPGILLGCHFRVDSVGYSEHRQDTRVLRLGCVVDNTVTGANQTNNTPASAVNGGPLPD